MKKVHTPVELVDALGGLGPAATFFAVSKQVVWNWQHRAGRIPSDLYFEHKDKLRAAGLKAAKTIWFPTLKDFHELPKKDGQPAVDDG